MDSVKASVTASATNAVTAAHVGIIMDGNGRWAKQRGLVRAQGHTEGLKAAKRIVKAASDLGIKYLTLYVFSTENWKRAASEVGPIMGLLRQHLRAELDFYRENKLRIRYAGDITGLPRDIQAELTGAMEDTKNFGGMQVILAINYGGRGEIVRAINRLFLERQTADCGENSCSKKGISEEDITRFLDNPDIPDPDLVIRSAGEYRTSNFLLWQSAYSEYYICEKLWPDWDRTDLEAALDIFRRRERRFGGRSGA